MSDSIKVIKLDIDEMDELSGVDAIALVEEPAIEADFMYFSKVNPHAFESYSDYPDSVSNNAKRGIELNEKVNNKCATQVGKVRAQQLANKENISVETIKRMYSYLSRAEEYYDEGDTEACGTISYLLWGGLAGKRWSESKLKELGLFEGDLDVSGLPSYENEPSGSLIVKDVFVSPSAGETEEEFIGRCIPVVKGEGYDDEQSVAICYSYWEERMAIDNYMEELFDFIGYIDGLPVFSTPEEASEVAEIAGCSGYHEHPMGDLTVYMPCETHEPELDEVLNEAYEEWKKSKLKSWDSMDEKTQEDVLNYLESVAEDSSPKNKFNTIGAIPGGTNESNRAIGNSVSFLDTPTTKIRYRYDVIPGKGSRLQSNSRDFCTELITRFTNRNKVFRKEDINQMSINGVNTGFGPGGVNQYNIFNYRGGNNCRHRWEEIKFSLINGVWADTTMAVIEPSGKQKTESNIDILTGRTITELGIGAQFSREEFADKQILAGPLMIPNKLIYRFDMENGEFYVFFSEETIQKIAYKFMQNNYNENTNIEHDMSEMLSDVVLVESWIVDDPMRDKSLMYSTDGKPFAKGTWFGIVKVKNKEIWDEYVKTGLVRGFSVEGFFIDELINKSKG